MAQEVWHALQGITGQEVTLRFPNARITGKLVGVERETWGYVLHLSSSVGDHFVAFPGEVLHIVVPRGSA